MSKLRSDELVNMEGDGAPSFPQGATSIAPTADNQVATKLYVDSALSAASGNAVSPTAPTNPSVGSFWTDTSVNPSLLKTWNGSMWIEFAGTAAAAVGVVVSLPSLSATNLEHAPATITASAAQVSNATLFITKWYKDDVEIDGATGSTYVATEPGVYRYEERWADNAGNVLTPSLNKTIELLAIEAPSIIIPVAGTGLTDFDYTAESSAIANVGTVDTLGDDDAFDVKTYTGNSSSQKLTTGLDMSGSGGLFWLKQRNGNGDHWLYDSERGPDSHLRIGAYEASNHGDSYDVNFENDGVTLGSNGSINYSGNTYVGWSFVEEPGFFDVVKWIGNGNSSRQIPHSLGSTPGFIIVKKVSSGAIRDWWCWHKSISTGDLSANDLLRLNEPDGTGGSGALIGTASSTMFEIAGDDNVNASGNTYIAYIFADNPSNQIKCGSYQGTNYSGTVYVDCGFDPQWVLIKSTVNSDRWRIYWNGSSTPGSTSLAPNTNSAEDGGGGVQHITFTGGGFTVENSAGYSPNWSDTFVFMAIGSPKTTTSATQLTLTDTTVSKVSDGSLVGGSTIDQVLTVGETVRADTTVSTTIATPVFNATTYTGNGSTKTINTGIDLDNGGGLIWIKKRGSQNHCLQDTEQGLEKFAAANTSGGFSSSTTRVTGATSTGYTIGNDSDVNESTRDYASWSFRKAPAFFDVVTYTGQYTYPASYAVPHSLGSVPGMIITKNTSIYHSSAWQVWHKGLGSTTGKALDIKSTAAEDTHSGFFPTAPDADNFYLGDNSNINSQNQNYVAYVFADTPGVIKCGTYTGTGSSQTIDTGFKPKFVLTKSRSHSSDWYLMDSVNSGQALYSNSSNGWQNVPIGYVNNGFTVDGRNFALNEIGYEYIYMAIAEDAEVDITSDIYASGTVSASSGNTITLSDVSGTWSTGMKVQGVTTDTKDYPDPVDASAVTFASSQPVVTSGTVNTWDYAEWNLSYDAQFSSVVHEKAVPLTATGTQAGPDSFPIQAGTEYFVRTKYASSLPSGQSDWSAVTRFLTKANVYADDVFSTYLYTSDGNPQTVNNGIDLAGEGGMLWVKSRTSTANPTIFDSERSGDNGSGQDTLFVLETNRSATQQTSVQPTTFTNTGYQTTYYAINNQDIVSWAFRKAPGFFDVVTWTGDGTSGRNIPHNLGSVPGMIIARRTDVSENWGVWHRSLGTSGLYLNATNTAGVTSIENNHTSTTFEVSSGYGLGNSSGGTYVAYIFAHDDARFGTNSDESIIKCGYYFGNDSTDGPEIDLGFEPQFVLIKSTTGTYNWFMADNMRGVPTGGTTRYLNPNSNGDEVATANEIDFTPTGFKLKSGNAQTNNPETYIYMAIRRPHKPATVATDVFAIDNGSGSSTIPTWDSGFPVDMSLFFSTAGGYNRTIAARLLDNYYLNANTTDDQATDGSLAWDSNVGWGKDYQSNFYSYMFRRAPGFFDVVTADYPDISGAIPHNLGVAPELIINKPRNGNIVWSVGSDYLQNTNGWNKYIELNSSGSEGDTSVVWDQTAPTATHFTLGSYPGSSYTGVFYLFASLDGISKVGSYTGTGSDLNVDCGFTAGARFILIKRTDSTGDWYVWDTERGVTGDNDPYSLLNTTDIQVTNTDYIDPLNAGFTVTSSAPAALNASGGTYLFLAIA